MIELTKADGSKLIVNSDHIERIECCPNTVVGLGNGTRLPVMESAEEVVRRVIEFRRRLMTPMLLVEGSVPGQVVGSEDS